MKRKIVPVAIIGLLLWACQDEFSNDEKLCVQPASGVLTKDNIHLRIGSPGYIDDTLLFETNNTFYSFIYDSHVNLYNWINIPETFTEAHILIHDKNYIMNNPNDLIFSKNTKYDLVKIDDQIVVMEFIPCVDLITY